MHSDSWLYQITDNTHTHTHTQTQTNKDIVDHTISFLIGMVTERQEYLLSYRSYKWGEMSPVLIKLAILQ